MLLTTKLFVPQPHGTNVARPRLLAKLDAGLAGRLLLIAAPAGFGKTTLVTDWIDALRRRHEEQEGAGAQASTGYAVGWLSLGEDDNAAPRFFAYLIAALQRVDGTIGRDIEPMLVSSQLPPTDLLMTLLINDIAHIKQPFVLVLDDYHLLTEQAVHDAVSFLIEKMPPLMKLVITTRIDPPLPLARWRARRMLTEVRTLDLRFTVEEATSFLVGSLGLGLGADEVAALEKRTEGWIAGLQLAALSLQGRVDVADFIQNFTGSHTYIVDYLIEEVLQRQPADVQAFLYQTSILERLCAPLCNELTGRHDGQAMLEGLARANLFLVPLDNERRWFRYHHLFRTVLQRGLHQNEPAAILPLHRAAGLWFAAHQLPHEAIHHLIPAQEFERAAQLIEMHSEPLSRQGEHQTVALWLQQLPATVMDSHPRLILTQANLLLLGQAYDAAEAWLQQHVDALSSDLGDAAQEAIYLIVKAGIAAGRNQYAAAIGLGQAALVHSTELAVSLRAQLLISLGIAYYYENQADAALAAFSEAAKEARQAGDLYSIFRALRNYALLLSLYGHLREAIATHERTLQLVQEYHVETLPVVGWVHIHLAGVLYERGDLVAMRSHLDQGQTLSQLSMTPEIRVDTLVMTAMYHHAQGEQHAAEGAIAEAMALVKQHQMTSAGASEAIAWQVRLWLAYGHVTMASDWAVSCGLTAQDQIVPIREPEYVALVWVLLAQEQPGEALALLEQLVANAHVHGRVWLQIELFALRAVALAEVGDTAAALSVLRQVLQLAEPEGYIQSFVKIGPRIYRLCRQLQPMLAETHLQLYLQRILAAFALPVGDTVAPLNPVGSPQGEAHATTLVEPLSERELEVLRLVADGLSNSQIAERLTITVGTVKRHLNNIFGKLEVSSRTQAVARGRELALF